MTQEKWIEWALDESDRDTEKALALLSRLVAKLTEPKKGYERGGLTP